MLWSVVTPTGWRVEDKERDEEEEDEVVDVDIKEEEEEEDDGDDDDDDDEDVEDATITAVDECLLISYCTGTFVSK